MSVSEYLQRARDCAAQAERTTDAEEKSRLLKLAEKWLKLAMQEAEVLHPAAGKANPS